MFGKAIIPFSKRLLEGSSFINKKQSSQLLDYYRTQLAHCIFILLGGTDKELYIKLKEQRDYYSDICDLIEHCDPHFYKPYRNNNIESRLEDAIKELSADQSQDTHIASALRRLSPLIDKLSEKEISRPTKIKYTNKKVLTSEQKGRQQTRVILVPTDKKETPPNKTDEEHSIEQGKKAIEALMSMLYDPEDFLSRLKKKSSDTNEEKNPKNSIKMVKLSEVLYANPGLRGNIDDNTTRALSRLVNEVIITSLFETDDDPSILSKKYGGIPVIYRVGKNYFIYFHDASTVFDLQITQEEIIEELDRQVFPGPGEHKIVSWKTKSDTIEDTLKNVYSLVSEHYYISRQTIEAAIETETRFWNKSRRLNLFKKGSAARSDGSLTDQVILAIHNAFKALSPQPTEIKPQKSKLQEDKPVTITRAELSDEVLKYKSKSYFFSSNSYNSNAIDEFVKLANYKVYLMTVDEKATFEQITKKISNAKKEGKTTETIFNDDPTKNLPILCKRGNEIYLAVKELVDNSVDRYGCVLPLHIEIRYIRISKNNSEYLSLFPPETPHIIKAHQSKDLPKTLIARINEHKKLFSCLNEEISEDKLKNAINKDSYFHRRRRTNLWNYDPTTQATNRTNNPKGNYGTDEVVEAIRKRAKGK